MAIALWRLGTIIDYINHSVISLALGSQPSVFEVADVSPPFPLQIVMPFLAVLRTSQMDSSLCSPFSPSSLFSSFFMCPWAVSLFPADYVAIATLLPDRVGPRAAATLFPVVQADQYPAGPVLS